jgi:hypothetical protein
MSRRRRCKRGQDGQALGRSRGGFSSKIHLKFDFDGLPLAFHLTGGEASDSRNFEILLDIGPDIAPRAVLGDKDYDSSGGGLAGQLLAVGIALVALAVLPAARSVPPVERLRSPR